jgi:hypothetical protein
VEQQQTHIFPSPTPQNKHGELPSCSVSLPLTIAEVKTIYEALGHEPSEVASHLRRRLAPLVDAHVGAFGRVSMEEQIGIGLSEPCEPCSPDHGTTPPDQLATCP